VHDRYTRPVHHVLGEEVKPMLVRLAHADQGHLGNSHLRHVDNHLEWPYSLAASQIIAVALR